MADKRAKDTTTKKTTARGETAPRAASNEAQTEGATAANPDANEEQQGALGSTPAGAASGASASGAASGEQAQPGGEVFEIAVLPLQQTTLFPGTVIPLSAG